MEIKEVEKAVFRKLISNPKTLASNLNKVAPEDFSHLKIARTVIEALNNGGNSVHFSPSLEYFEIILRELIPDKEELDYACKMLAALSQNPEDQRDLDLLIKELKNERMCREITRVVEPVTRSLDPANVETVYNELVNNLLRLPISGANSHSVGQIKEVYGDLEGRLKHYFQAAKKKFPAGLKAFNETIGGFAPGELVVLTAGTGQGKSALMLWWADQFLRSGASCMYASIEMSYEELTERYHALVSATSCKKIRNKLLTPTELTQYNERIIANTLEAKAAEEFLRECESIVDRVDPKYAYELSIKYPKRKSKFYILDLPRGCSPARIEKEISRISLDSPLHVVFVDYLNIMDPNFHSKDYIREQGSLAKDLKAVARRTNTVIFTGAQLNTSNMEDGDKITTDSIKYARAISENADWVIGFRRDANDVAMKQIRLELAKHRFSASATAAIEVDFDTMQIADLGRADDLPAVPSVGESKPKGKGIYH